LTVERPPPRMRSPTRRPAPLSDLFQLDLEEVYELSEVGHGLFFLTPFFLTPFFNPFFN
jgi:hypothetical protein